MKKRYLIIVSVLSLIAVFVVWLLIPPVPKTENESSTRSKSFDSLQNRMSKFDSLYDKRKISELKKELQAFTEVEVRWSKELSDNELAKIYDRLNEMYDLIEDVRNARYYAKKALEHIDSTEQKYFYAITLNDYALAESQLENYDEAINIQFRALDFLGSDTLNSSYGYTAQNLGNNFRETNDLDLALEYYDRSEAVIKAVREIDSISNFDEILGYVYANIGYTYTLQGKIKAANEKYLNSIQYFDEHELDYHKNMVKSVLASNYVEQQKYQKAEELLDGLLDLASKNQDFELLVETSITLFKLNVQKGRTDKAFRTIDNAEENIGVSNSNRLLLKILDTKVNYFKDKGRYEKAFPLLEKKIKLQDSINGATRKDLQRELNVKYQTDLKNERIDQLEIINQKEKRIRQIYLVGMIVLAGIVILVILLLRRINKQKKQVEDANYTKDQLFSIIAHDLRSPIMAMQGMGDLIQYHIKKNDTGKLQKLGHESQTALTKIDHLLQNLLEWSLANKEQINYHPETVDINDILDENLALFNNALDVKKIEVKRSVDKALLKLDRNMISSAIRNILSNAIKLSHKDGQMFIEGKRRVDEYVISIEDEAGGIPDDIIASIDKNDDQLIKGRADRSTGLGLRLVRLFITKNKGRLKIERTAKGSRFIIYLPFDKKLNNI